MCRAIFTGRSLALVPTRTKISATIIICTIERSKLQSRENIHLVSSTVIRPQKLGWYDRSDYFILKVLLLCKFFLEMKVRILSAKSDSRLLHKQAPDESVLPLSFS